ncbi:MAG: Ig-like domain-containing protein [Treponemataceae bacterium]|nr:Ig-like domain-containing protein [Treponemataceae bacterium]
MKQTMQKIAIALCMALAFATCKNDDPETGGGVETVTIVLNPTELTLKVGEEKTLVPTITGTGSKTVTWKSSDNAVATVNNGKVTAKGEGTATITATAEADTTKKATCSVTVEGADVIQPSGIEVSPTSLSLKVGETGQITATIGNADALDAAHKKITWTSSNEGVAKVSDSGLVTAVSAGTATITATTTNGKDATCTVSVTAQTPTSVAASDDEWNFVGKADASYGSLGTPKDDGSGKSTQTLDNDISVKGEKNQLTLVLSKASTGVGENKSAAPKYKYDDAKGLCIKGAAFKIDGIKGAVTATIQWYLNSSKARNLEVTVGVNGKPAVTSSGTTTGDKDPYTVNFDGSDGTTLYIGASDELFIKSITITPQSGGGTQPSTPTNPPYAGSAPTPVEDTDHSGKNISLTDTPLGYASLGNSYVTTGGKTVTNRADLLSAISKGGVIIIDGMIDMSDGYLPDSTSDFPNLTTLDAFVKKQNKGYSTYAAWVNAYALACTKATEDKSEGDSNSSLYDTVWAFNKAYGNIIKLSVPSNTTLIGAGPGCGIKGGSIQITSAKNVQIRNLTIKDAFDPFPHHEAGDQYNAQWDGVVVEGSENVWIDHCTFEDTLAVGHVYTAGTDDEKWQMYDGLCDIKNRTSPASKTTNVTVSNCIFRNHDKTMLIGSGTSDGNNAERFVTLQGNYFYNCGQRLPMVRNTTIHILNNYYNADSNAVYKNSYAVGCRETSIIYTEANYFDSGIQYSFDNNQGTVHASGDKDNSAKGKNKTTIADSTLFSAAFGGAYSYSPVTAELAKTTAMSSAGAGYTLK